MFCSLPIEKKLRKCFKYFVLKLTMCRLPFLLTKKSNNLTFSHFSKVQEVICRFWKFRGLCVTMPYFKGLKCILPLILGLDMFPKKFWVQMQNFQFHYYKEKKVHITSFKFGQVNKMIYKFKIFIYYSLEFSKQKKKR